MNSKGILVCRTNLSVPADKLKFIEKAWTRDADCITLDLEDGVDPSSKAVARGNLKDAIPCAAKGGSAVYVRVNNEPDMILEDLDAAVRPGLSGISIPKVEDPEQLVAVENEIARLEKLRGMPEGTVSTLLAIESAYGFLRMRELAAATTRGDIIAVGNEDFSRELGMEIISGDEMLFPNMEMLIIASAYGLQPRGLLGRMTDFKDLDGLFKMGLRSYQFGFRGSTCIHPSQVEVLNRAFRPQPDAVDRACRIVAAMEEATRRGDGCTSVDGRMVDKPVAARARKIVEHHRAIEAFDQYKRDCRARHGSEFD